MSYRGQVAYQQKWPSSTHSDRGYYGLVQDYRNESRQEPYSRMDDRDPRELNHQGYNQQRDRNYNSNQQYSGYRNPPSDRNAQDGGYRNEPTHRYPETFRSGNQPSPNESSWGNNRNPPQDRRGGPQPSPNESSWGNNRNPPQDRRGNPQRRDRGYENQNDPNYRDSRRSQSPVRHDNHRQGYDNREPYGQNRYPDSQDRGNSQEQYHSYQQDRNAYSRPDNQPVTSPGWNNRGSQVGYHPQGNAYDSQIPAESQPQTSYRDQPGRGANPTISEWDHSRSQQNSYPPDLYEQSRPTSSGYNQRDQTPQRQHHDEYRRDDYNQHSQPDTSHRSEGPQVLAKTSGSTAVFGIVARVDTSPTRRDGTVTSPTRSHPPPLTSPSMEYPPPFDQYRDSEPPCEQQPPPQSSHQHHQYHHALTPISEKPSPPSSISSRGHSQDAHNQYTHPNDSRQSWQNEPDRGYPNQQHGHQTRPGYDNAPQQYQDRPQPQSSRSGYRDYEYTESSGYGSESTHYTERSYNEPQRFPEKGQYDNQFPPPPPEGQRIENWPRSPSESYSRSPPRDRDDGFRDQYRGEDVRSPSQTDLRSPSQVSQGYDQRNRHQQVSYNQKPQDRYGYPVSVPAQRNQNSQEAPYKHQPHDRFGPPVSIPGQRNHSEKVSYNQKPQDRYGPPVSVPEQRNQSHQQVSYNQKPQDRYGLPVSVPTPGQYDNRQQPVPDDRYNQPDYNRAPRHESQMQPYGTRGDANPPYRKTNADSGVEESHVPSVRAARSMFEKNSDPRRPPPAPKPMIAPKPNNVNPRPIPPRPTNFSQDGWGRQDNRNQFHPQSPPGPKSPLSPRYDSRPQHYEQRMQPSHSQSMDNLDDRSRYQPPPQTRRPPQHAQSMQNLDDRSRPAPEESYHHPDRGRSFQPPGSNGGYRNSNSGGGERDDRPMVVGVKYNEESGTSVYAGQSPEPPRQGSWERQGPGSDRPSQPMSPTRPHNHRSSWSTEPSRGNHQQSYNEINKNAAPITQSSYNQPRMQNTDNDSNNYVPDVVARSYEMANRSQESKPQIQYNTNRGPYNEPHQEPLRDSSYDSRRQTEQNAPENRNSSDRWPTPPPPITQEQQQPMSPRERPQQNGRSYNDDWRRPGPPPAQSHQKSGPMMKQPSAYPSTNQPQGYRGNQPPSLRLPPPPQQPYAYDSESSEVDVDAPTPPPSNRQSRHINLSETDRGVSPYERNKPVPVGARNPDPTRRLPYQPQNVREQPLAASQDSAYSQPPNFQSKQPPKQSSVKSPPPLKPQRNSTSLSPKLARASVSNDPNDFDLDVGATQPLANQTSREKLRLVKSGGMANRKPPSRQGSTSNLLEIADEDDFQIEVTDSDLSTKATPIEVHRMESMRVLKAKKERDKEASAAMDRAAKQRASQKTVLPPADEDEHSPTKTAAKKPDTKLIYKKPSAEAAKTIPMPQVTEPAQESHRRPPTYLGFGHTPEKPKTDLLSQFKSARDSAIRTAAEKQDRALKSVSALVKFNKKEPKPPPKPKLTPAERNAKLLDKMNVEVRAPPEEEDDRRRHHHKHGEERGDIARSSTRSSSTIKAEKYDGDDDTTNGSRHGRGRGKDRQRDNERAKSRGRSRSRDRNLSPVDRGRSRHRSKSRERSLSPEDRHRPRRDAGGDRRFEERRRRDDDSSYHRRSHSPDYSRYRDDDRDRYHQRSPPHRQYQQPYDRHREPDWVEQFRRGRQAPNHQTRRAWVNDPRRVEVTTDGRRRELDMDAFEREVKRATSYNSDFEQPEPRRQMIPTKLSAKSRPPNSKRQPPGDWMNALKEKNRSAAKARFGHVSRY